MKRVGFIYEKIYDLENIKLAIQKSSKGKRNQNNVVTILNNADYFALEIQKMLINKTYAPSKYTTATIKDGANKKERVIYKPKYYPDQIIHWALMLQLEPLIMRGMYKYCCGSVPGRGTSFGKKALRNWLDCDKRNTKYCLKADISKFYPSINNELLKAKFRRLIKDRDCLWLIDAIVDSAVGLPIGNFTSQWFSNFYLQELDHFIKEKLGVNYYIRYVDDLVLLGPNKKKLHKARKEISVFLSQHALILKGNWQIFRIDKRDIDFLGFRFFRNKTILRKRNALRIKRRVKKIYKKKYINYLDACALVSYWGWIKSSDSFNFYTQNMKPYTPIKRARKVVSHYAKIRKDCE